MSQRTITKPNSTTFKVGRNVVVTSVRLVSGTAVAWRMHQVEPATVELRSLPLEDLTIVYATAEPVLVAAAWPFPQ